MSVIVCHLLSYIFPLMKLFQLSISNANPLKYIFCIYIVN
nr:MAG TPA: hypothetical protein [Caudoviricetes sp.]